MKKWFALFLAAVMVIGCLTGCSGKEPEATKPETEPVETATTVPVKEPEITELEATDPVAEIITHGKMIRKLYKLANPSGDYEDLEGAIAWAVKNGVVTDDAPFDPEAALTHLDMARFLYRYAKALDVIRDSDKLEALTGWVWDESEITEETDREAVAWAVGSGIMQLYQRQFLPDEAVSDYEYRTSIARLSSLVKEVRAEQQAAIEATEPEETEPEETEESGSEAENSGSSGGSGSSSSGSGSGSSSSSGSGNSGGSSSGSSGGSSSGSSGGSNTEPPVEETEAPSITYLDMAQAAAAGNAYAASRGAMIDYSLGFNNSGFYFSPMAECAVYSGGQEQLNQDMRDWVAATLTNIEADCKNRGEPYDVSYVSINCAVYIDVMYGTEYYVFDCYYG